MEKDLPPINESAFADLREDCFVNVQLGSKTDATNSKRLSTGEQATIRGHGQLAHQQLDRRRACSNIEAALPQQESRESH